MEIDPYEVLEVQASATPLDIKKAYKRLSLKYHPDKINQTKSGIDESHFPKIQFAYSILSDVNKRRIYDTTGSLSGDGEFDWREYFQGVSEKITIDMIDEDRKLYQGLREEQDDILHNFEYYEGDFLRLFEVIPHLEFDETQEIRVFDVVDTAISEGTVRMDKAMERTWAKYKKSRKTKVRQVLKKMAREAQEASELADKIGARRTDTDGLQAMIRKKNSARLDTLILGLEAKYGKGTKRSEPDDAEFERIQAKLKKRKGSK